jgi:hypothetical protein
LTQIEGVRKEMMGTSLDWAHFLCFFSKKYVFEVMNEQQKIENQQRGRF